MVRLISLNEQKCDAIGNKCYSSHIERNESPTNAMQKYTTEIPIKQNKTKVTCTVQYIDNIHVGQTAQCGETDAEKHPRIM